MGVVAEQTMRIAELEAENASLRKQLEATQRNPDAPPHTVPVERHDALTNKYNELAKSYQEREESTHAECNAQTRYWKNKARDSKQRCGQWQFYAERKLAEKDRRLAEALQQRLGPTSPGPLLPTPNDHREPENLVNDDEQTPRPPRRVAEGSFTQNVDDAALPANLGDGQEMPDQTSGAGRLSSRTLRITSSQTTDMGSDPVSARSSPPIKHELSSDNEPIVVSARSLKRKRSASAQAMSPPVRIKQEANSPEKPIEIKSEDFSSPVSRRRLMARHETFDLDVLPDVYTTPRRQRMRDRAGSEEARKIPSLPTRVSSPSEGAEPEPTDWQTVVNQESGPELAGLNENVQSVLPAKAHRPHVLSPRTADNTLQPLSVNVATKRRLENVPIAMRRRRSDEDAAAKAALLSEDGEVMPEQRKRALPEDKATPKTFASRRLDTMLDEPSRDFQRLVRYLTPDSVATKSRGPFTPVSDGKPSPRRSRKISPEKRVVAPHGNVPTPLSAPRPFVKKASPNKRCDPPSGRMTPTVTTSKPSLEFASPQKRSEHRFRRPQGVEGSPPPVRPEEEPLRLRPLSALRLEDFKINPKYMGADFAFADTFRGREQRRCLQACTRPDCCGGAFAHAAEAAGNTGSNKSDAEMLEGYLGPTWQQMMGAYPRERRDDILKQARAAAFADQFGKHRHAFERRSTPPGFWRTDMPTTQEEADDRVKADELIRQKVEERWREAMREGDGRWLFRDE